VAALAVWRSPNGHIRQIAPTRQTRAALPLLLPKDPVIWILEASYSDGIGAETPHSRSTKQMMKRKSLTGRANFPHIHPSEFFPGPEALRDPRDRPISRRSPWQNGYSERLIGSIRRDCLDHVVVFGERHLGNLLTSYQKYYNEARTHLSLHKDAPIPRAVQTVGLPLAMPVLGGLHHQYFRA
jgi:integrase-like protein